MYCIDVILPIPLKQTFTYEVNKDEARFLKPGMRVAVPFGKAKIYTGIVLNIHQQTPQGYEIKSIDQILDEFPLINEFQIQHWQWMASYYLCTLGEVLKAAIPNVFLLESETIITLNTNATIAVSELNDLEFLVLEALQSQPSLHINDIRSILDRKNVMGVLTNLIEKKHIVVQEEVHEKYRPKIKRFIKLSSHYSSQENLKDLLDTLSRAPKQREVIMTLLMLSSKENKAIESVLLQKKSNSNSAVINKLIAKEILEEYFIQKDRVEFNLEKNAPIKNLSAAQTQALDEINTSFIKNDITLLQGVTSSGKTEIYVQLIDYAIKQGKQVLYMLPEIALTTQLISRLQNYFGEKISVYHSKYSISERVEVWNNVLDHKAKAQIIIGARSSLFLPFSKLGLLIVDEEHEPSFKQYAPSPRYNGRDSAVVLAKYHGAKLLMGSATPSLESFFNATNNRYGLVTLKKRFGNVLMPEIELVDVKEKHRKKLMKGHFSDRLLEEINEALKNKEQVILFQNRRGYSPIIECTTCGISPQCPNCDVSLTFHQYKNQLRCHYCGYHTSKMISCIACGNETLDSKGFGTEQIELELKELFPNHQIARMDQDSMKGKHAYAKIIEAFELKEIDILVGTQMLAKGLDFRNVSLVGVMNADNLLNFPDFRAHERSFQLLQQVAGRAGRTKKRGKVIIQTYNPYHQILQQVSTNNFEEMYQQQLEERYRYKYPPFYRMIKITLKDRSFQKMDKASLWLANALKMKLMEQVLGPETPPVGRVRNLFITHILIKIPKEQSLKATKNFITSMLKSFNAIKEFSSVRLTVDVDNY
ncbi:MAG: primosomal protein N' [Flavobacteriaceae bacterium]|nr:primosomal protein N' [Flavobacteriaceae bacterium]